MSLQQFQLDVGAQVSSIPPAANVPVFIFRPRAAQSAAQIQTKIDNALNGIIARNGKAGLACTVLMPLLDTKEQELPGPYLHLRCTVRIQENVAFNMGANGTLIPCEDFAIAVAQALHLWTPGGVSGIVRVSKNTATPNLTYLPKVTYDVDIESELTNPDMGITLPAVITVGGGRVSLATMTAGASVYYTVDGTTPFPSTGEIVTTAQLYAGPFAVPEGALLRVAAFSPNNRGSDIACQQF
jgi:hypothetical protein